MGWMYRFDKMQSFILIIYHSKADDTTVELPFYYTESGTLFFYSYCTCLMLSMIRYKSITLSSKVMI